MSVLLSLIVPSAYYLLGETIANALWGEAFPCYARALKMKAFGIITKILVKPALSDLEPSLEHCIRFSPLWISQQFRAMYELFPC
jgi:hypothetical protein